MAKPTILLIGTESTLFIEAFLSQLHYECHILKATEFDAGLDIASQEFPTVIFLENRIIDRAHVAKMGKFKDLTPQPYLIVFQVHFDNANYLRELLQAGVDDYMHHPVTFEELEKSVEPILGQSRNKNKELVPIVEKLLNKIEQQENALSELLSDLRWYENNLGRQACDCADAIKQNKLTKPKSTALRRIEGTIMYYDDEEYQCDVCNTIWVREESNTESECLITWKPKEGQ